MANRARLPIAAIERVRVAMRDDQAVGVRINGSDLVDGGIDPDEAAAIARHLTTLCDLDYVHVSAGRSSHNEAIVPPMDVPHGVYAEFARTVRLAVEVPVIAVARIKTPEMAESILAAGQADVIAEARALIAEPEWVWTRRRPRRPT